MIKPHFNALLKNTNYSSALLTNSQDAYFAATNGQFLKYNIPKNTVTTLFRIPENEIITQIRADGFNLLLSSTHKVYLYNYTNDSLHIIYDAKSHIIKNIKVDKTTHNYWISTNRGLVQISNNSTIDNIKIPTINPKTVVSIIQNKDETIFAALNNNEVWSYDKNQKWKKYGLPSGSCRNLSIYKNKIFVATSNGLFTIENEIVKKLRLKNYTSKLKKCIVDNKENLWVLPEKGIPAVFDYKTLEQKKHFVQNPNTFWTGNSWNDILCDSFGTIWVAGWMPKSNGIIKYDYKNNHFIDIEKLEANQIKKSFSGDYFNRISVSLSNNLLFSSFGGWNIVDQMGNVQFAYHTFEQDIPSHHIAGICDDSKGNIWFATSEGLNIYNLNTSKNIRLSQIDGLQTDDLINGFCKLKDGKIAIGNEQGFSVIDTKKILIPTANSDLQLISTVINGVSTTTNNKQIVLEHQDSELILLFSDLSFANKLKVNYRYRFKGENKWNYLGHNAELTLVKLASATYDLEIQAGNNLTNWKPKILKIQIEVKPKFYQTWWFMTLGFLLLLLFALAINIYLLKQQKIKNNLTQDIKNAEMKTLRSQMNPHFMFNTLNSINSFIIENKSNEASKYLTMFSKLMRNILENSKYSEITLEKEIQTLKLYIQLEAVRLDHKFDYYINIDNTIDDETLKIPPLILQPFVENAIWHGLHNKKTHGTLKVDIALKNNVYLEIKITDDGIGRKATAMLKKQQTNHKSYGISITVSRLKLLNEANEVDIIDLYNKNEIPCGTLVNLKIYI